MSKGIVGFIKLTLSPTFSRFFTNSLYCHCSNNSCFFIFLGPDAAYILEIPWREILSLKRFKNIEKCLGKSLCALGAELARRAIKSKRKSMEAKWMRLLLVVCVWTNSTDHGGFNIFYSLNISIVPAASDADASPLSLCPPECTWNWSTKHLAS